jgi:carboxymethylenebutenolidase
MAVQRGDIDITSAEGSFSAYVSAHTRSNGIAVVVLQEIFGVNANIRAIADSFANAGYAAVAPDLYWRQEKGVQLDPSSEEGRGRAMELMKGLNPDQAVSDGAAALNSLRARVSGLDRSAAVGYCFGGGVAYLMAVRGTVDTGVAYYGTGLQTMLSELDGLNGRLLLHIAAEDHLCPPDAQNVIAAGAAKVGDRVKVVIHAGVGHAFARVGGAAYNEEAADRANTATMDWLELLSGSA